jgi:hypothetical protein
LLQYNTQVHNHTLLSLFKSNVSIDEVTECNSLQT